MPCADCQSIPAENPIAGTLAVSRTLPNVSSEPRDWIQDRAIDPYGTADPIGGPVCESKQRRVRLPLGRATQRGDGLRRERGNAVRRLRGKPHGGRDGEETEEQ